MNIDNLTYDERKRPIFTHKNEVWCLETIYKYLTDYPYTASVIYSAFCKRCEEHKIAPKPQIEGFHLYIQRFMMGKFNDILKKGFESGEYEYDKIEKV